MDKSSVKWLINLLNTAVEICIVFINGNPQYRYEHKMATQEETAKEHIEYNGVAELEGEDAEKFLEYESSDLTEEEELSLIKSDEIYSKYCKS